LSGPPLVARATMRRFFSAANTRARRSRRNPNEGHVNGRELVITRYHTPTLLDLVAKPLDQVASTLKVRAEAERLFTIASAL
jgi:hypothetical protein